MKQRHTFVAAVVTFLCLFVMSERSVQCYVAESVLLRLHR